MKRRLFTFTILCVAAAVTAKEPPKDPRFSGLSKHQAPYSTLGTHSTAVSWNLGPTGMRGWFLFDGRNGTRYSREILVRAVERASPAEGKILRDDVITGCNGQTFRNDARIAYAKALQQAEASGTLRLQIVRDGDKRNVELSLPKLGSYATSAPYDCPKSKAIFDRACDFVVDHYSITRGGKMVSREMDMLLLLASGTPEREMVVRHYIGGMLAQAEKDKWYELTIASPEMDSQGHWSWAWGYRNLLLCEYFIKTGDPTVLDLIEKCCELIEDGQAEASGLWGHSLARGGVLKGYGAVNQTGLVCLLSLILADEIGIEVDPQAIVKPAKFFLSFVGRNGVSYGDHPGYPAATNNGAGAIAAVCYDLMGVPQASSWFARLAASSDRVDQGHTGPFFNYLWTPLGTRVAGKEQVRDFHRRVGWTYDLARHQSGGFVTQAGGEKGGDWMMSSFALHYAIPTAGLRILGADRSLSPFIKGACPESLKQALKLYWKKDFSACLAKLETSGDRSEVASRLAVAAQARLACLKYGISQAKNTLANGDLYLAAHQLGGLKTLLSEGNLSRENLERELTTQNDEKKHREGRDFYNATRGYEMLYFKNHRRYGLKYQHDHRDSGRLERMSKDVNSPYKATAAKLLREHPLDPAVRRYMHASKYGGQVMAPLFALKKYDGKHKPLASASETSVSVVGGEGWEKTELPLNLELGGKRGDKTVLAKVEFDLPGSFSVTELYLRHKANGPTLYRLNGTVILEVPEAVEDREEICLKRNNQKLLKPGTNVLTAELKLNGRAKAAELECEVLRLVEEK